MQRMQYRKDQRNVRPILKQDNLTKNKHYTQLECAEHLEKVRAYDVYRNLTPHETYLEVLNSICS